MKSLLLTTSLLAVVAGAMWIYLLRSSDNSPSSPVAYVTVETADNETASENTAGNQKQPTDPTAQLRSRNTFDLTDKKVRTIHNAQLNTGLSPEELNALNETTLAAFFDPETAGAYQASMHSALAEEVGADEAEFHMRLLGNVGNWEESKRLVEERTDESGNDYSEVLLKVGLASGKISVEELEAIVSRGYQLPANAIHQLATNRQVDTIVSLAERGLLGDMNYRDPITGTNALDAYVQNVGFMSHRHDPEEVTRALKQLIAVGMETQPQTGGLDPLDYALANMNSRNADLKLAMAKVLFEQGVPFQQSHRELILRMPEGKEKDQFMQLFANSI